MTCLWASFVRIVDDEIELYLKEVIKPIAKKMNIDYKIPVFLIHDESANAAAISQGAILIQSGLFIECRNGEELVGVLAHEIAHIKCMHIARYTKKPHPGMVVLSMGLGALTGGFGLIAGFQVMEREALRQMRGEESQADHVAMEALKGLRWPTSGLRSFLKRLANLGHPYLSTHPSIDERLHAMEQRSGGKLPKNIDQGFKRVQAKLRGYVDKNKRSHNSYESVVALLMLNQFDEGLRKVEELEPKDRYYFEIKGDLFFGLGRLREAIDCYQKALKDDTIFIAMKLAHARIELSEKLDEAIVLLNKVLIHEPDFSYVWRLLATAYGKKKQFGNADYCLAEEARIQGDIVLARKLLDKGRLPESKVLQKRRQDLLNILK